MGAGFPRTLLELHPQVTGAFQLCCRYSFSPVLLGAIFGKAIGPRKKKNQVRQPRAIALAI